MSFNGQRLKKCSHIDQITVTNPSPKECRKCINNGETWVHLRTCLQCGEVGCCGSSKNQHADKHYKESGHHMFYIEESNGNIAYCYADDGYFSMKNL